MNGVIYKATNTVNGKVYIGQTIEGFERRMKKHLYLAENGGQTIFYKAIRKYGEENFIWEIVGVATSKEELDEKEIFWIKELNSYAFNENSNGYNMTKGGDGTIGFSPSEETRKKIGSIHKGKTISKETREKMSKARRGEKHWNYGNHHSEETKKKIGESLNMKGENNPMFGKKHSERARKKIGDARRGAKSPNAKSVVKLDLEGNFIEKFDTAQQGADSVCGDRSGIIKCCKGKYKTHKGFKWVYADDYVGDSNVGFTED